jgi:hypothetical protein
MATFANINNQSLIKDLQLSCSFQTILDRKIGDRVICLVVIETLSMLDLGRLEHCEQHQLSTGK